MPKYRNTKKFIQPVRINGQRTLVYHNEVIYSEKPLDLSTYTFLEEVSEDSTVTAKPPKPITKKPTPATLDEVSALKKLIEETQEALSKFPSHQDLDQFAKKDEVTKSLQDAKDQILEETPTVEPEEIKGLHEKIIALSEFYRQLKEDKSLMDKITELMTKSDLCLKRLEIIKSAVEVIDKALHNLEVEVYENGEQFIIEDDTPKE